MTRTFNIEVNNEHLVAKEFEIGEDYGMFEVWAKGELQYILHLLFNGNGNSKWQAGPEENYNMSDDYITLIGGKIESYYE